MDPTTDAASPASAIRHQLFIDGRFVDAESGETQPTLNPHDNTTIADVAMAGHADVDKAVDAAERAFPAWRRMAAADRGRILLQARRPRSRRAATSWRASSRSTPGIRCATRSALDVPRTAACFRYFGGMADKFQGDVVPVEAGFLNYLLREPVGVVGQVVPWNFPLMFTSWKMGPALAAGNCIVLKPAEITPLTSLRIAELMAEAGMPDGVVNIVPGPRQRGGPVHRRARADREDRLHRIDGDGPAHRAGQRGQPEEGAARARRQGREHRVRRRRPRRPRSTARPGRSSTTRGRPASPARGWCCTSASPTRSSTRFTTLARSIRVGNPLDPATEMGPLTSTQHRDRVLGYVDDRARSRAASVLSGGKAPDAPELARGCYVEPTVVKARTHRDRVAQEEVFGPFVTVLTFANDDEALAIANGTEYGLGSGLWTRDLSRAHRFARELQGGHGLDQQLQARQPGLAVRRRGALGLRARDGVRRDARVHAGEERLGQRRREDPAVVSALMRASGRADR